MSWCRLRIELKSALQFGIRAGEIPVEDAFRFTKVAMRFSIFLVELNRLHCCLSVERISVERFYVNVRQEIPNFRDTSPGTSKCRILFDRALEKTKRPSQILLAALV